jgi:ssDNA-binding replication factor A large subunit
MVAGNYEKIVEKIAQSAGVEKEEVLRRIEAKRAKLSGLISQEGAAQVVAAELGVNFDNEKLKIDELLPGMRKVNTVGKVITLFPVRTFKTQKGEEGKVCNFVAADDTSNIKIVLWDTNHISLIEKGDIKEGSSVEIVNASMRDNELHLGSFSELKPSTETFSNVVTEKVVKEKPISDFKIGDNVSVRAFVVQSFEPRFFEVNKETGRKITEEERAKGIQPEKRALINIVLDDGTETMRAVLFHESLKDIGLTALDNLEQMIVQREDLLGKEFVFSGNVRRNNFFNNEEFIVESAMPVEMDVLIAKFEGK